MVSEWGAWRQCRDEHCHGHGHGVYAAGEAPTREQQRQTPPHPSPPLPSLPPRWQWSPHRGPHDWLRVRARSHPAAVRPCTATRSRDARACPWGRWRTPRRTRRASSWRAAPPECPTRARLERWRALGGRPSRVRGRAAHGTRWIRPRRPGCRAAALPRGHFQQAAPTVSSSSRVLHCQRTVASTMSRTGAPHLG